MKLLLTFHLSLFCWIALQSQTISISPQVINAAGDHRAIGSSGIYLTDNVGEPFTETIYGNAGKFMITQGFIQPETVTQAGFTLNAIQQSLQCLDKEDDAFIALTLTSTIDTSKYRAKYFWTPSSVCPNNDCAKIDTLKPGAYSVMVRISYTTNVGVVRFDSIPRNFQIDQATQNCIIKVFSGISANNDGKNDFFSIENIKEFPNNRVTIYNRWGTQLADINGYDNEKPEKRWPSQEEADKLPSSTYFYIIELEKGKNPVKGWVELIKN
ncbi:MAG: gliding motility-associated C-terminal domain-containing protein [bacterium]|nr:gliding motility-associated C-terminal domain-containing protein [bacterium]